MKSTSHVKVAISAILMVILVFVLLEGLSAIIEDTASKNDWLDGIGAFIGTTFFILAVVNILPWLVFLLRRTRAWRILGCLVTAFMACVYTLLVLLAFLGMATGGDDEGFMYGCRILGVVILVILGACGFGVYLGLRESGSSPRRVESATQ